MLNSNHVNKDVRQAQAIRCKYYDRLSRNSNLFNDNNLEKNQLPQTVYTKIYEMHFNNKPKTIYHGFAHANVATILGATVAKLIKDGELYPKEFEQQFSKHSPVDNFLKNNFIQLVTIALLLHDGGRLNGEDGRDDWEKESADNVNKFIFAHLEHEQSLSEKDRKSTLLEKLITNYPDMSEGNKQPFVSYISDAANEGILNTGLVQSMRKNGIFNTLSKDVQTRLNLI